MTDAVLQGQDQGVLAEKGADFSEDGGNARGFNAEKDQFGPFDVLRIRTGKNRDFFCLFAFFEEQSLPVKKSGPVRIMIQ